tara:strand:- start:1742 stop:2452 length:711 start_codon:yes stop_codon:yes gene_type:complete
MSTLPKLNATPKFELTIPSTQQTVKYRPYLVKEEKILLLAFESKDEKQSMQAMVDTIEACIEDIIDVGKLTSFDVEYMFTQIRSKSVGETGKVGMICSECEHRTPTDIDLSTVEIVIPDIDNKVKLTDEIVLELKYPSFQIFVDNYTKGINESEFSFMVIRNCILAVQTAEERITMEGIADEEIDNFIDSLSSAQFKEVNDFISSMPSLEKDVEFKCENCGHENKSKLKGIQDFFS